MTLRKRIANLERRAKERVDEDDPARMPCATDWWIWLEHLSNPEASRYTGNQFEVASQRLDEYLAATPDDRDQLDPHLLDEILNGQPGEACPSPRKDLNNE